jgi:hypothetical protein
VIEDWLSRPLLRKTDYTHIRLVSEIAMLR